MNPEQISDSHRKRLALVYIRQSSAHQVIHHQESQRRERAFVKRATQLGWPCEGVEIIDEDLGESLDVLGLGRGEAAGANYR